MPYKIETLLSELRASASHDAKEAEARWQALDEILHKQKEWAEGKVTELQREFEDMIAAQRLRTIHMLKDLSTTYGDAIKAVALGIAHLKTAEPTEPHLRIEGKAKSRAKPEEPST